TDGPLVRNQTLTQSATRTERMPKVAIVPTQLDLILCSICFRTELNGLVPVLDRLGELLQSTIREGPSPVAIVEKLFGHFQSVILFVNGRQGADGFLEPNQTRAWLATTAEQDA